MYGRLNENIDLICSKIDPEGDVYPYVKLTEQLWKTDVSADVDFQSTYRSYWQLNAARLGKQFVRDYFTYFEELKQVNEIDLERVVRDLYELPTNATGRQAVQFSFASKMVHMLRPHLPVYDSTVEAFFFLPFGSESEKMEGKLKRLLGSHQFLAREYERVLKEGLLATAMTTFRARFGVDSNYTDEKIIDTLIWKFVSFARWGAIRDGEIRYR